MSILERIAYAFLQVCLAMAIGALLGWLVAVAIAAFWVVKALAGDQS